VAGGGVLRADAERFDRLAALPTLDAAPVATEAGATSLCLPPRRKSEREPQLVELAPFTDAKKPAKTPAPPAGALVYVIRAGVLRSQGKAIA
jgi:hypothetical protein